MAVTHAYTRLAGEHILVGGVSLLRGNRDQFQVWLFVIYVFALFLYWCYSGSPAMKERPSKHINVTPENLEYLRNLNKYLRIQIKSQHLPRLGKLSLRKIVRSQSKMVQRPYSENYSHELLWKTHNRSLSSSSHKNLDLILTNPGAIQPKPPVQIRQRPKISTIIASVDKSRSKSGNHHRVMRNEIDITQNELRLSRNALKNITAAIQANLLGRQHRLQGYPFTNTSFNSDHGIETPYETSTRSSFFPSLDEQNMQNLEPKLSNPKDNAVIIIPEHHPKISKGINSSVIKGIYISNVRSTEKPTLAPNYPKDDLEMDNDKVDYFLKEITSNMAPVTFAAVNANIHYCTGLRQAKTDIDTQEKYSQFDIEPTWVTKTHFWNHIFDSRYESLMSNPKWPPLKVILIPRTQVDSIWKKTFEDYHNNTVKSILSNIVKKLQFYSNLKFTWHEVSHLSQWWKTASLKSRTLFRRLVKAGRLEITTGGFVEPDEATTHIFGLVHQLIEGHQWLKYYLNYTPQVAWLTTTVTHSPTVAYLLSAAGIHNLVLTNLHYSWEHFLAEYQYSDFMWSQSWDNGDTGSSPLNDILNKIGKDRYTKNSMLTHFLQFNSAGFRACGPNKTICINEFNFAKSDKTVDIDSYNIKEKSELLLEQYSKTGTISSHNVVIAPLGGPFRYEAQAEFDYQFNNYQKLSNYINDHRDIYKATVEFGSAKDYFDSIIDRQKSFPTLKGDFVNFADIMSGSPAYWSGYFTSRPLFKILLRRLESTLRTTEILFAFAVNLNAFREFNASKVFNLLIKARETTARLLDRNVVGGTLAARVLRYAHKQILNTVKDCWYIQEVSASLLMAKPRHNSPYLQKYVYREGEFVSSFRTVSAGDQIFVFNSLSQDRTEIIEIFVNNPNIRIIDHRKKEVTIQINPVWKYNSDNFIKLSRRFFKVIFAVVVPPLTLELYKIKDTYDATQSVASVYCLACTVDDLESNVSLFPFNVLPIETGDIQLESYKHRLIFDETTGFLKTVVDKGTNIDKTVLLDFGAFRSSDKNSGMFLFNTNLTKPLHDVLLPFRLGIKSKVLMITSGPVTTEFTSIYGRFLQNSVKIYNLLNSPLSNAVYIESKVDYEVSPKNREVELFMSVQTDIANGNPPEIITDDNGFQYMSRFLNISRRIESNMYPITTMAYIQDRKQRLTFITDHAQGVTALQEGQLVIMFDRRVLFNDGRGTNEGLADSTVTYHRYFILLENVADSYNQYRSHNPPLPSISAIHLSNSLNYLLDFFVIGKNQSDSCSYAFFPLAKTSFPCDVSLINYRVVHDRSVGTFFPNAALMILHRQGTSCHIVDNIVLHCNGESKFSLDKILHNTKAVYQTNLVGTTKGTAVTSFSLTNFPPMELATVRIHF